MARRESGGGRGWPSVVVADVDRNGSLEIVTAHSNGWVTITRADSATLAVGPSNPRPATNCVVSSSATRTKMADLEILVVRRVRMISGSCSIIPASSAPDGPSIRRIPIQTATPPECFNEMLASPIWMVTTLGNDRTQRYALHGWFQRRRDAVARERVVRTDRRAEQSVGARRFHYDHAVDLRGYANCTAGQEPLEPRPNFADSAPSFADVNGDGVLEIIIVGNQYDCRTSPYTSLFHSPYILRADRTRWSGNGFDWTNLPARDLSAVPLSEDWNVIETVMPNPVVVISTAMDSARFCTRRTTDACTRTGWNRTEHHNCPIASRIPPKVSFALVPNRRLLISTTMASRSDRDDVDAKGSNAGGHC